MISSRFASHCAALKIALLCACLICSHVTIAEDNSPGNIEGNSPRVNYMLHCQGCHLPGGIGHPGIVPALKDSVARFLNVDGGREYLVQVPGVSQSSLDDANLAEVLNWMIPTFDPNNTPNDFAPFTADEIASFRSTKIRNVSEIRLRLLRQLDVQETTDCSQCSNETSDG